VIKKTKKNLSIFKKSFTEECEWKNEKTIEDYKSSKPEESEKEWQVKASSEEYEFCLYDKGLSNK